LYRAQPPARKYEEYAYVLDFNSRGKSSTVRGRDGIIITAIGEDRLTLLEVLISEKKGEQRFFLFWERWIMIKFHRLLKVN
jgi:predicted nucleic acid-binding OB-fold protein